MKFCVNNTQLRYFVFDGTLQSLKDNLEDNQFYDYNIKRQTVIISNNDGDMKCNKGDYVIEVKDGYWQPCSPRVFYEVLIKINEEEK